MRPLQVNEIVKAVGAIDYTSADRFETITSVSFDSRKSTANSLFVPLIGQTDGHDYIDKAIENGATVTFWAKPQEQVPDGIAVILVEDTLKALQDLAAYYLAEINPKVIGITGSSGKTTTKDMTAAVLASSFNVHKTDGNYNNEIGLPFTILQMPEETEVLVLEMGMSDAGEIAFLSRLAKPDVAIITMIGESHIEYLGSRENIAKAKLEILDGLVEGGTLIYPGEEPLIANNLPIDQAFERITVGLSEKQNVYAMDMIIDQHQSQFVTNLSPTCQMVLPVSGAYNVQNALSALATAYVLGLSMEQVQENLAQFKLSANRMEWTRGYNDAQILNDAYNANPSAMNAVIQNVSLLPVEPQAKRVLILADMLELGPESVNWHRQLSANIKADTIGEVLLFGQEMYALYEQLKQEGYPNAQLHYVKEDHDTLIEIAKGVLQPNDIVLLKGSNGTGLLRVVEALKQ